MSPACQKPLSRAAAGRAVADLLQYIGGWLKLPVETYRKDVVFFFLTIPARQLAEIIFTVQHAQPEGGSDAWRCLWMAGHNLNHKQADAFSRN
jgi:hypothetical protein